MLTPSDSNEGTSSAEEPRGRELSVEPPDALAPRAATEYPARQVEHYRQAVAPSNSGGFGDQSPSPKKHPPIDPQARHMDGIDFGLSVLSSRYMTLNLVLILIASAVLVAAIAFGILAVDSHANPGFTVGLTSAGTVAVAAVAGAKTVKRRRASLNRQSSNGVIEKGSETDNPLS